jgi:transposase
MSVKRNYRRSSVKDVCTESLRETAIAKGAAGTTVGLDVAKHEIVAVIRWPDGSFERPWSVGNPNEIGRLVECLVTLKETCGSLTIGLESTGNYSESVRSAMTEAFLEVHRLSGKGVSDYKEIFDGVPSQHDGKDAAMIAELTHFGKGTPWPFRPYTESEQTMRHHVARLNAFRTQANQWLGRLEGILAKHWPELTSQLRLSSATLLNICLHYSSPAQLCRDSSAREQLRSWGRGRLSFTKIEAILESARTTAGIPVGSGEMIWLREIATEAKNNLQEVKACEKKLKQLAESHESLQRHVKQVGGVTLCTIWSTVGDPRKYSSSGAFLKALGLNLKELSSGKHQGQLRITKRGPSLARKLLYYWALRAVQEPCLKSWYRNFQRVGRGGTSEHRKMKGLVAMMRKLCKSLWYVYQHELTFDYAKVFPGKPLQSRQSKRHRKRTLPSLN